MVFFNKGERVWAPHATAGWVVASVLSQDGTGVLVQTDGGEELRVADSKLLPFSPESVADYNDMIQISDLVEPVLLHNLRQRYEADKIYTLIGPVLISLNPYKKLPIYTKAIMQTFSSLKLGDPRVSQNPHIFAIANNAYRSMTSFKQSQSLVISGESGAGKTESTKLVLQYLAYVSDPNSTRKVEQQILESSPILEAFGNAKTIRNDNSSRFGKFTKITFDLAGRITGAEITNYLLEKPRVANHALNERSYHVFYQLCAGANAEERKQLLLAPSAEAYSYLNQGKAIKLTRVDDAAEFLRLKQAMAVLGIGPPLQLEVFRILAGILNLGNCTFVLGGKVGGKDEYKVADRAPLAKAAKLLGTEESFLEGALIKRSFQASATRKSHYSIPNNQKQCEDSRDALAKALYGLLFDWLVEKVNAPLKPKNASDLFIGVLDIFGFEIFEQNGFEQLCINLANEKILQLFNAHMFKSEQAEYAAEAINFTRVTFKDNAELLEMIEKKPVGILPLLDEECVVPNGNEKALLEKISQQHQAKQNWFYKKRLNPNIFGVKHYAGDVDYDVIGILDKNRDTLSADIEGLLHDSTSALVAELAARRSGATAGSAPASGAGTLSPAQIAASKGGSIPVSGPAGMLRRDPAPTPAAPKEQIFGTLKRTGREGASSLPQAAPSDPAPTAPSARGTPASTATNAKSKLSVSAQFREQLATLTGVLSSTSVHYVWCIKPNMLQLPSSLESAFLLTQMRCTGIMEVIKIRKQGFAFRKSFAEFINRFRLLFSKSALNRLSNTAQHRDLCLELLLKEASATRDQWQVGKTKVFLKDKQLFDLEAARESRLGQSVGVLVHAFRTLVVRRRYQRARAEYLERKRKAEEERKRKEEEARRKREEEERKRREEELRKKREEEERKRREEEERKRKEEELRRKREEEERRRKEEAEAKRRADEEARLKREAEAAERARLQAEAAEAARRKKEEEERIAKKRSEDLAAAAAATRKREEERKRLEEKKREEEAARRREEQVAAASASMAAQAEQRRLAEERRQQEEERRAAEEERQRMEAVQAAEDKRAEDRRRIDEQRKRIEEQRKRIEEERRKREEAARAREASQLPPPPVPPPVAPVEEPAPLDERSPEDAPPEVDPEEARRAAEAEQRRAKEAELQRKREELEKRRQELARRKEEEERKRLMLAGGAPTNPLPPPPVAVSPRPVAVPQVPAPALPPTGVASPPGTLLRNVSRERGMSKEVGVDSPRDRDGSDAASQPVLSPRGDATMRSNSNATPMPNPKSANKNPYESGTADWHRYNYVDEMLKTERDYIRDVTLMIEVYLQPMKRDAVVSTNEVSAMFANIESLIPLNKQYLKDLEACPWPYDKMALGEIFLRYVEFFKMYKVYCVNRPMFVSSYEELKKNSKFKAFLDEAQQDPRCKGLALPDYHIKPLQRVTKYPLLLKEIIAHTPKDHPDYANLVTAEQKIKEVVTSLNQGQKLNEENSRIVDLQNTIEDVGELVTPTRRLLQEGEWVVRSTPEDKPQQRHVFLFNDLILMCVPQKKKKFNFLCKNKFPIGEVRVVFVAEDTLKHSFQLEHMGKQFILSAPSDAIKSLWYNQIYHLKKQAQMSAVKGPAAAGNTNTLKKTAPGLKP